MTTLEQSIKQGLLTLRSDGPRLNGSGICFNLALEVLDLGPFCHEDVYSWLEPAFVSLGLDTEYPVPHPWLPKERAYGGTQDLWTDEYGSNRRHLLDLLIRIASGETLGHNDVRWPHPMVYGPDFPQDTIEI